MTRDDRATFDDERGRGWLAEIQHGYPVPSELGIHACRFTCPGDPAEPVRLGFVLLDDVAAGDEEALREALEASEPATEIG
jgi:hypothetical protein